MRLLEYESKEILSAKGIPIPLGVVVTSYKDVSSLPSPNIIKAQIPIGGRQKAGGVFDPGPLKPPLPSGDLQSGSGP